MKAGDLLHVTRAASPQFVTPILFRVIRELDWTTFDGWVWLDGYQVDERGEATARRSIFVMRAALRPPIRQVRPGTTIPREPRRSADRTAGGVDAVHRTDPATQALQQ
ncbi:hypothetical protein GCM10027186_32500 [Micromonospora schwarzwaldensis]